MSKTFSLNSVIPRISSVTKSDVSSKASNKRATGKVLMIRPSARTSSKSVLRSTFRSSNWVGMASAAGIAVLVVAFGFYIYMINAYASKGYELKKQQAAMTQLEETHKRLMIEQAASGSILKINDVASAARMIPVTGEEFLVPNQVSAR